ncbi:MAG: ABC transporter substrate-binding protein [Acidobacteriota bacterium]|nr:ABC transporter substrate-binding protein [Acidobacteriota bacterium]MDQ5871883.1 ABC transporter substrate-binding protein [Acidobacteriota bacterium]
MKRLSLALVLAATLACRAREESAVTPGTQAPGPTPTVAPEPVLGFLDESREGVPIQGGVLRRRLVGEPATLNAVMQTGLPEQQVLQYLSRPLVDVDARLELVPGLAERREISADGLEYRFFLAPNAVWEDGSPVTSADAVFTIRKAADPKVPSPVFKPLFADLEAVEAIDAKSFRARFRRRDAQHAFAFTLPLLPEKRFAGKNFLKARDNRAPLSNGPYRLVSWKTQQSIELERNPRWPGTPGNFDRIVFRVVPENAVAYRALVEGELDETWIDQSLKERSATDRRFASCCRVIEFYNLDYNYIALNNRSPFFSDSLVRRAMTMLLDRPAIVRGLYHGSARIISGPWAPDSPAYDATVTALPFDPRAAIQLLEQAGWRDTDGDGTRDRAGRELEFDLLVSAGSTAGRQINEIFAAELARAGVKARIRSLEWASFVERVDSGEYDAASLAWAASDANPDPFPYWHSSQFPPAGVNVAFYRNAAADELMEEARNELDPEKRRVIYHRLHRVFRDDPPVVFVVNASQKYAFRQRVRGLVTSPLGLYGFWPGPLSWWGTPDESVIPEKPN